jgi:hypothetical protein
LLAMEAHGLRFLNRASRWLCDEVVERTRDIA